jgi:nucleoid-associated protein YgaU
MRIFYANRDKLRDPDHIQVGQQLNIPPDDNS